MGRQQEKHWWLAVLVNPRGGEASGPSFQLDSHFPTGCPNQGPVQEACLERAQNSPKVMFFRAKGVSVACLDSFARPVPRTCPLRCLICFIARVQHVLP